MAECEKNPERYWFKAVYRQLCTAVVVNYRGEKLRLTDLIFDDEEEMQDTLTQGQVWLYNDCEAGDMYHPAEVGYRKNLELYEVYDDYGRCVLLEPMAGIRVLIERKGERTRIFRKEEKTDMTENNDRQPRKVRCSSSIGVVRKTFEEVLDVLSDWHEKGYRLRSVEWHSDTQQYTIQGSHDTWVCE